MSILKADKFLGILGKSGLLGTICSIRDYTIGWSLSRRCCMRSKYIGEKSNRARLAFGSELRRLRDGSGLSVADIAYSLDVSMTTVFYWMNGSAFPQSIFLLKKLQFLFSEMHELIQDILHRRGVAISDAEWGRFRDRLRYRDDLEYGKLEVGYGRPHKHLCDDLYRAEFGRYLRDMRIVSGVSILGLSEALGVKHSRYFRWESGLSIPRDIMLLGYLDRLYGGVFDVIFGICPKYGLDLDRVEKRKIAGRVRECRKNTWDVKSSGWLEHHSKMRAERKKYRKNCGRSREYKLEMMRYFLQQC